jgi:hypothetical protein
MKLLQKKILPIRKVGVIIKFYSVTKYKILVINIVNLNKNHIRLLLTIKIPKENNELRILFCKLL